ncbi:TolC family protein, partial [bacterium]|nr:TolC family protein [bacterium]
MKKRLARGMLAVAACLLFTAPPSGADDASPPKELPQLVEQALARNPEVKASQARWEMYTSRVKQAGALDDPMLMLKLQSFLLRDPFNSQRDPMSQRVVGISQQLPFWGKRALKEELAAREAEAYQWQIEERKLELARMVKETWYQIYLTDRERQIVDKNIRVMDDFIALAETRYSVGQGAQQDVFKAQVERSRMLDMQISLEQRRKSLQATLNTLLFRPAETPVGVIPDFEIRPVSWSPEQLQAAAAENRPLLKGFGALMAKGEAGHRLAEKELFPDFNLSFEYMQRDPINEMEAGYDM